MTKVLMVQLTYECNRRCTHCAYDDLRTVAINNQTVMSLPVFTRLIHKQKWDSIKISGGEPLMVNGIERYIDAAKKCAHTILYTNLTVIPHILPDEIYTSFYGYMFHPKIDSQYNAVCHIKNICMMSSYNIPVTLNTPVFSRDQIIDRGGALDGAKTLHLPLRIVKLLNHGGCINALTHKKQMLIAKAAVSMYSKARTTCSLRGSPRCDNKVTVTPDGKVIQCTATVRGLRCVTKVDTSSTENVD